jgi:hypothetical protein
MRVVGKIQVSGFRFQVFELSAGPSGTDLGVLGVLAVVIAAKTKIGKETVKKR